MTFPVVASEAVFGTIDTPAGAGGFNVNPLTIPIPSGTVGELIVVILAHDAKPSSAIDTTYSGTKWKASTKQANGSAMFSQVFWKTAEGGDQLQLTLGFAEKSSWAIYRITGGYNVFYSSVTNSTADGDPPLLTPTDGLQDYLWIVARAADASDIVTTAPTGYTNLLSKSGDTQSASISVARRSASGASEDPAAFVCPSTEQQVVWTLAVTPVSTIVSSVEAHSALITRARSILNRQSLVAGHSTVAALIASTTLPRQSAVSAHSVVSATARTASADPLLDDLGGVIFDQSGNALSGTSLHIVSRSSAIFASSDTNSIGHKVLYRASSVASVAAISAAWKRIRNRSAAVAAVSSLSGVWGRSSARTSLVDARSDIVTGYTSAGTAYRQAHMAAKSLVATIREKIHPATSAVIAHSSVSAAAQLDFVRSSFMTPVSVVQASRIANSSVKSVVIATSHIVADRKRGKRVNSAVTGHSIVSVAYHTTKRTVSLAAGHSSLATAPRFGRRKTAVVTAKSMLVTNYTSSAGSRVRMAFLGRTTNNAKLIEVRNG